MEKLKIEPNACGKVAGVAGLEPVTSAVTGQRSNQLSYTPARSTRQYLKSPIASNFFTGFSCPRAKKRAFGQQTPRRWGWGTPLKKRTATRTKSFESTRKDRTGCNFVNISDRQAGSHLFQLFSNFSTRCTVSACICCDFNL
jgi:hypothetical protein